MAGTNDEDGTENNGKPDQGEPNLDWFDNDEYMPITTLYNVRDLIEFQKSSYQMILFQFN